jgi:hypothetical protein
MGFLKSIAKRAGVLGAVTGLGMVSGGANLLAGKLDPRLGALGLEGLKYGIGEGGDVGLGDKVIGADAEAAILRNIMAKKAITQGRLMKRFEDRASKPAADIVRERMGQEKAALQRRGAGELGDIERSMQQKIAQRGLGGSSIGSVGTEALKSEARGRLSQRLAGIEGSRLQREDDMERSRLMDLSNIAGKTLAGQDVPIQFRPVREKGFGRQLLEGAAMGMVGSASKGFGSRLAGG